MAAALLRHYAGDRISVRSAGSAPADTVHPQALAVMRERGIDLAAATPQRVDDGMVRAADVVVTMGCGDACPVLPGKRYEDWNIEDPAGKEIGAVRTICDAIDARVQLLLANLMPEALPRA